MAKKDGEYFYRVNRSSGGLFAGLLAVPKVRSMLLHE
jgi:hypothetical protein